MTPLRRSGAQSRNNAGKGGKANDSVNAEGAANECVTASCQGGAGDGYAILGRERPVAHGR